MLNVSFTSGVCMVKILNAREVNRHRWLNPSPVLETPVNGKVYMRGGGISINALYRWHHE